MHMFCLTLWNLEIWWFGSAFIIFHNFSSSFIPLISLPFDKFLIVSPSPAGTGCWATGANYWPDKDSGVQWSVGQGLRKKNKDSWDSCTLWCSYKWKRFKSFIHWNYFEYLWLWRINMLGQCSVTIAGGTLWLQLQALCGTTSPCNWDKWYSVFFACILRLHEYNMF